MSLHVKHEKTTKLLSDNSLWQWDANRSWPPTENISRSQMAPGPRCHPNDPKHWPPVCPQQRSTTLRPRDWSNESSWCVHPNLQPSSCLGETAKPALQLVFGGHMQVICLNQPVQELNIGIGCSGWETMVWVLPPLWEALRLLLMDQSLISKDSSRKCPWTVWLEAVVTIGTQCSGFNHLKCCVGDWKILEAKIQVICWQRLDMIASTINHWLFKTPKRTSMYPSRGTPWIHCVPKCN